MLNQCSLKDLNQLITGDSFCFYALEKIPAKTFKEEKSNVVSSASILATNEDVTNDVRAKINRGIFSLNSLNRLFQQNEQGQKEIPLTDKRVNTSPMTNFKAFDPLWQRFYPIVTKLDLSLISDIEAAYAELEFYGKK